MFNPLAPAILFDYRRWTANLKCYYGSCRSSIRHAYRTLILYARCCYRAACSINIIFFWLRLTSAALYYVFPPLTLSPPPLLPSHRFVILLSRPCSPVWRYHDPFCLPLLLLLRLCCLHRLPNFSSPIFPSLLFSCLLPISFPDWV